VRRTEPDEAAGSDLELMTSSSIVSKYLSVACLAVLSLAISWMHGYSRVTHSVYLAEKSFSTDFGPGQTCVEMSVRVRQRQIRYSLF
jgi:hypothetical protein